MALGAACARSLPAQGGVLYLRGELGAGKTTCARAMLRELGVTGTIRSPTYTLVDTYSAGALTCVHIDLYRVGSVLEVEELGLRDLTVPEHLLLIEWPERGGDAIPPPDLNILVAYRNDAREAHVQAVNSAGRAWLAKLNLQASIGAYVYNLA